MNPREQLLDELARAYAHAAVDAWLRELQQETDDAEQQERAA